MGELERERIRRDGRAAVPELRPGPGVVAFVGKLTSGSASIGVGKFLLVNPVEFLGAEAEGAAATAAVATAVAVPVLLLGPGVPVIGDDLVCRFIGNRWVAEKSGGCTTIVCIHLADNCSPSAPVVGASVQLYDPGGGPVGSPVTTDAAGTACVTIPSASSGTYTFTSSASGYTTLVRSSSLRPVIVAACSSGSVSYVMTKLFGNVRVNGCQGIAVALAQGGVPVGTPQTIGASGFVTFTNLASGSYTATLTNPRIVTTTATVTAPSGCLTNSYTPPIAAASGYISAYCCLPTKRDLVVSDSEYGAGAFTVSGTDSGAGSVTTPYNPNATAAGCSGTTGCAARAAVTISYEISAWPAGVTRGANQVWFSISYMAADPVGGFGHPADWCPTGGTTGAMGVDSTGPASWVCNADGSVVITYHPASTQGKLYPNFPCRPTVITLTE